MLYYNIVVTIKSILMMRKEASLEPNPIDEL